MSFADISRKSAVWLIALLCVFPLSATNPQKKEMKELNVKKVSLANVAVENIPALLDKRKGGFSVDQYGELESIPLSAGGAVPYSSYG